MASEHVVPSLAAPLPQPAARVGPATVLILIAVVYAGLNAVKPLTIDDAAYAYYSAQIAVHPLDPYGFNILWYYEPQPANQILAPPVLPYSWALSRAAFGERPWLWKLALLPWCLLLVGALHGLLRRFAPGMELPLTAMTVLGPALLPSLNLMLDVPALALALTSVRVFLGACDRDSFGWAVLAGLLAGLAMETKYTGGVAPGVMLLAAATTGRWRLWPAAAVAAAQVFVTWELLVALHYGDSHFLLSFRSAASNSLLVKGGLIAVFFSYLGGLAPFLFVLGLAALGARRRWQATAVALVLTGFALIVLLDAQFYGDVRPSPRLFGWMETPQWDFPLSEVVFGAFGAGGTVVVVFAVRRLWADDAGATGERRRTLFLVLWLGLEALAYYPLTPFPAARRVLGALVVLTLLIGRLAARAWPTPGRRRAAWLWAGCAIVLGLGYYGLDLMEANAEKWGAETAAAWTARQGGDGRVWYVGHWGFQYYAEACGMQPAYAASDPAESPLLHKGDWLVRPEPPVGAQGFDFDDPALSEEVRLTLDDPIPLRTVSCFYCGLAPLEHQHPEGPRIAVRIYRVVEDFRPK